MKGIEHVDEVHAWIVRDIDGTEGIPAIKVPGLDFPVVLMSAGTTRSGAVLGNMRAWAKEAAKQLEPGQTMVHAVFSNRVDLEQVR